jgi:radical SAM family uncharacterized protein/radical SAM-linked protein
MLDRLNKAGLLSVERPARYAGGEWNRIVKDGPVRCRLLLLFPDAYEIGMSHLGLRILYSLVNSHADLAAERAFTPWPDMEALMRGRGEPLRSLETGRAARDFDLIGFSLQHELNYTNMLTMLDLAGLPLRASERAESAPLVIAGGPAAFNPEPVAPFIDLFLIGDAEEQLLHLMLRQAELEEGGLRKGEILAELAKLDGMYAPALYQTEIDQLGGFEVVSAPHGRRPFIDKAIVTDLDRFPFPAETVVPFCDIVHDRAAIELARGCSRGCRFCQAGVIYMPERERNPQQAAETVIEMLAATGFGDVGLSSLTPNDYRGLRQLVAALMERLKPEGVALSLASLSPSGIDRELLELIGGVRRTGLTIAPEAGTQRLRDVINKGISEEEVIAAARLAFELGWRLIKLYFMLGLPSETGGDVEGIAGLALRIAGLSRSAKINVAVSNFVPKPHTPFQWAAMADQETFLAKRAALLKLVRYNRRVAVKFHDVDSSLLEGVLSRGDRRVALALEAAWRLGCRFDGWGDHLKLDLWRRAFEESGVDPAFYLHRELPLEAVLPWSHIGSGVKTGYLKAEYERAMRAEPNPRCTPRNCPDCGACPPELLKRRWGRDQEESLSVRLPQKAEDRGEQHRWRLRYSKTGTLRLLSHLDMLRLMARVFRRAGVRTALSKGFHPQPKISFGPALPLGMEGRNEHIDALIIADLDAGELVGRLNAASPEGLRFAEAVRIDDRLPSLSAAIVAARYRLRRIDGGGFDGGALERFLASERVDWTRKRDGKEDVELNLRPFVTEMEVDGGELLLTLSIDPRREGPQARPSEIAAAAFSLDFNEIEVIREQQFIERNGELFPPIESEKR